MKPVRFRPEARRDVLDAQRWYEGQRPGLGGEFREELKRAIAAIRENPTAWPVLRRTTRRYLMHRFPYGVFYQIHDDLVLVVGVIHGHRHPRAWHRRS